MPCCALSAGKVERSARRIDTASHFWLFFRVRYMVCFEKIFCGWLESVERNLFFLFCVFHFKCRPYRHVWKGWNGITQGRGGWKDGKKRQMEGMSGAVSVPGSNYTQSWECGYIGKGKMHIIRRRGGGRESLWDDVSSAGLVQVTTSQDGVWKLPQCLSGRFAKPAE